MDFLSFLVAHTLELVTLVVSLVWLYLEYRASIWLWPVGIILPLLWIPICYQSHLYGMLAINIYYLVTSIIGWIAWLRRGTSEGSSDHQYSSEGWGDLPRPGLRWLHRLTATSSFHPRLEAPLG